MSQYNIGICSFRVFGSFSFCPVSDGASFQPSYAWFCESGRGKKPDVGGLHFNAS
jgi:hypothetical protein